MKRLIVLILTFAAVRISIAQSQHDSICYSNALQFIRCSGEIRDTVCHHLQLPGLSDKSPSPLAVSDTLIPIGSLGTYFDTSDCSLIRDRKTITQIYLSEDVHFQAPAKEGKDVQFYAPFSALWNEEDPLVVVCGPIFRRSLVAAISLRKSEQRQPQTDASKFKGIRLQSRPRGRPRDTAWNFVMVHFCFKENGQVARVIAERAYH